MKFSIITCTWNSERYFEESIESVLSQDYDNFEQIFVDGGSTDGTLERIKALGPDVKWVSGVRNGISNAMNTGVKLATGDVIAHLHSDDFYASTQTLSTVAKAFASAPDARWLYGRCFSVIDGKLEKNTFVSKACTFPNLVRRNLVPHPATFVIRSAMNSVGAFDTELKYAMDYDMWLRLCRRFGSPVQIEDYLSAFRFHEGSLSTSDKRAVAREDLKVRMRHMRGGLLERSEHLLRYAIRRVRD